MRLLSVAGVLLLAATPGVAAQEAPPAFRASCAGCHAPATGAPATAPSIEALRRYAPEAILNILLNGKMRIQATPLSDAERRAVAEFLGGRPLRTTPPPPSVTRCESSPPFRGDVRAGDWNGWGN